MRAFACCRLNSSFHRPACFSFTMNSSSRNDALATSLPLEIRDVGFPNSDLLRFANQDSKVSAAKSGSLRRASIPTNRSKARRMAEFVNVQFAIEGQIEAALLIAWMLANMRARSGVPLASL